MNRSCGDPDVALEADVHVVLLGSRMAQSVDIVVAGQPLATWEFSRETNGAHRAVRIAFLPHFVAAPQEFDPAVPEERPLGLGLQRLRWQVAERAGGPAEDASARAAGWAEPTPAGARNMNVAAITSVWNEPVDLPIWINYFRGLFGKRNLFVIDRGSTDGSTANLGEVNLLRVPRAEFDEFQKTGIINSLHHGLRDHFDTVIYTDCDKLVAPNLSVYADLNDYLTRKDFDHMSCVGLNIQHVISIEDPLDLARPILAQRRFAKFWSDTCKTAIARVPLTWTNGLHHCDRRPRIDPELFLIHTMWMDYSVAMQRPKVNRDTRRSERGAAGGHGRHWSYNNAQFVREGFLDPLNVISHDGLERFDFNAEIAAIEERTVEHDGTYFIPMDIVKYVELPDHLRTAF